MLRKLLIASSLSQRSELYTVLHPTASVRRFAPRRSLSTLADIIKDFADKDKLAKQSNKTIKDADVSSKSAKFIGDDRSNWKDKRNGKSPKLTPQQSKPLSSTLRDHLLKSNNNNNAKTVQQLTHQFFPDSNHDDSGDRNFQNRQRNKFPALQGRGGGGGGGRGNQQTIRSSADVIDRDLRMNSSNDRFANTNHQWGNKSVSAGQEVSNSNSSSYSSNNNSSPRHKQYEQRIKRDKQNFQRKKGLDVNGDPLPEKELSYYNHRAHQPNKFPSSSAAANSSFSHNTNSRGEFFKPAIEATSAVNDGDNDDTMSVAELKRIAEMRLKQKTSSAWTDNSNAGGAKSKSSNGKSNAASAKPLTVVAEAVRSISIPNSGLTLRELASRLSMKLSELKLRVEAMGDIGLPQDSSNDNDTAAATAVADAVVDADVAELIVLELGFDAKRIIDRKSDKQKRAADKPSEHALDAVSGSPQVQLLPRAPVVCVMGHVDHGKTTLLDALRKTNSHVAGTEAGGITQKLSAFTVQLPGDRRVVFLDTPGHAAFSAMRSHGAVATDVVVLVIALDDGVRPQSIEALKMAQEANSSVVVALNKVDKIPADNRSNARVRVLNQLLEHNLIAEEYGGDVQVVEVAGKSGLGLEQLMESILLQAEYLELKAATEGRAEAIVLDVNVEKGRGVVADVLVKWGSLKVGDAIVVGNTFGKVKSMINNQGVAISTAGPSDSVRMMGLRSLPMSGQELLSVDSENDAREISQRRQRLADMRRQREEELHAARLALRKQAEENAAAAVAAATAGAGADGLNATDEAAAVAAAVAIKPTIHVVLKADGVGTLEALHRIVDGIIFRATAVEVEIVNASVGNVTLRDIELAASGPHAIVLAFNVGIADSETRSTAKQLDVNIFRNDVIYRLEEELVQSMTALLPKMKVFEREGLAKVQQVFKLNQGRGSSTPSVVAGLIVQSGRLRNSGGSSHSSSSHHGSHGSHFVFRVLRNGVLLLEESHGSSLKRFKDTVHEVENGNECGLSLDHFDDFQEGDEVECCRVVWKASSDVLAPISGSGSSSRLDAATPAWLQQQQSAEGETESILQKAHVLDAGHRNYA